ncbi:hypothetical protein SAMN02910343_01311 [Dialister histaminiformans]|uniref:Uncharacterized protein n=1 Tax=Allisonella histaminiformans TaxID=209880 RepID=A0A1G5WEK9_9FIRM|nr:hypothetical protein SAMN02910343_01311 [Allisonella histaminiformans]
MTTSPCRHSPFLSRTGNVLHAFLLLAFTLLSFYKNAIPRIRLQIGFAHLQKDSTNGLFIKNKDQKESNSFEILSGFLCPEVEDFLYNERSSTALWFCLKRNLKSFWSDVLSLRGTPSNSRSAFSFTRKCHTQYPPLVEANVLASAQPCFLMLRHSLMSLGSYSPVKPLGFTPPWKRKLFGSEPPAHIPYF